MERGREGESASERQIQEQFFPLFQSTHTHTRSFSHEWYNPFAGGVFHITGWLLLQRDAFQHNANKNLDNQLDRRGDEGAERRQGGVQSKDVNLKRELGEKQKNRRAVERRWNWDISCVTLKGFNYFSFFLVLRGAGSKLCFTNETFMNLPPQSTSDV